jgi:hypothetical protein
MDTGTSGPAADVHPEAPPPPRTGSRRRSLGRWVLVLGGLAVVALGAVALFGLGPALESRRALEEGRAHLQEARELLLGGEIEEAGRAFLDAEERFEVAVDRTRSLPLRAASWIPVLGRSPRTVSAIADAGLGVASAGGILTEAILDLPQGIRSLMPRNGTIDPRPLLRLAPPMERAAGLVADARRAVEESPASLLVAGVAPAREEALADLTELESTVTSAAGLVREAPLFLGAGRPARYMLAAQNPAELRGTGGLMGAYSVLTLDEGQFRFSSFRPIQDLPTFGPDEIEAPTEEFAANWDRFGGAGYWLNVNMTPHFPSAATAMRTAYRKATGDELDGIILADPVALEHLLRFTGPVTVPEVGEVQADSVVTLVANEAYGDFTNPRQRKLLMGGVALTVFEAFLREAGEGLDWLRTVASAASDGRILINSAHPELQEALERAGVAGAFGPGPDRVDFLSVIQNNGGGNKMDFYLHREVTYTVRLGPSGTAEAEVEVELTNTGPDRGAPRYVIGPYPGISEAGENVTFVDVWCRASCVLYEASRDGEHVEVSGGEEVGARFFRDHLGISSGERRSFGLRLGLPEAWTPTGRGGVYRLTFLGQPTINPTQLTVRVVSPEGGRLVPGSGDLRGGHEAPQVSEDEMVWSGTPGRRLDLEVRLET